MLLSALFKVLGLLFKFSLYLALFFLVLPFLPLRFDFEPKAFKADLPAFVGPLAPNNKLDQVEYLLKDEIVGPESLAVYKGSIYTGIVGGDIIKITGKKAVVVANLGKSCEGPWEEETCGRPLGLRFDKAGRLYVVDAYYGVNAVSVENGSVTTLVANGMDIEGKPFIFGNDLVVDESDRCIYFTQTSSKWPLHHILYSVMEHENSGRLLKYDMATKKTTVLLRELYGVNGVELGHDGQSLLVSELGRKRILRYYIKGENKGELGIFAENLPGDPDNIRRSSSGGYWVAFAVGRSRDAPIMADRVAELPLVRKAVCRLFHLLGQTLKYAASHFDSPVFRDVASRVDNAWIIYDTLPKYGLIVELDANGEVIRSLHSPSGRVFFISEVLEHDGHLYLGSFRNRFLGRVRL